MDPESQLITAVEVLPGNAPDHQEALTLVEQAEANTGMEVEETMGDCAYGDGRTRQAFADAGRHLVAKVPKRRGQDYFPKEDFTIDLATMTCTCPAGHQCRTVTTIGSGVRYGAPGVPRQAFRFDGAICQGCPLRPPCVRARPGRGRTGDAASPGGLAARGPGLSTERGIRALPQAAPGRRTPPGATDATGGAPGALLWTGQDPAPTPDGGHRGQSDPDRDQGGPHAGPTAGKGSYFLFHLRLSRRPHSPMEKLSLMVWSASIRPTHKGSFRPNF